VTIEWKEFAKKFKRHNRLAYCRFLELLAILFEDNDLEAIEIKGNRKEFESIFAEMVEETFTRTKWANLSQAFSLALDPEQKEAWRCVH
jgi:hypothetical protein